MSVNRIQLAGEENRIYEEQEEGRRVPEITFERMIQLAGQQRAYDIQFEIARNQRGVFVTVGRSDEPSTATRSILDIGEELSRSVTQNSLNTFHHSGSRGSVANGMNAVQTFLQQTTRQENSIAPLNQPEKELYQLSYETLTKQLYGLSVEIPEFLILNGLKVSFIPFSQLNTIQIDRYIIEPLLQPWAGPPSSPNRILTIFGKNGMTYLIKAKYDQTSSQIFPPV